MRKVPTKLFCVTGFGRHRDLVAGADDQVDRPSWRVVADREAAENEAGREQNLGEADVLPV